MQLRSKHMWEMAEFFIQRRREEDKPVGTPDWVVAAMLEDLRALEAENRELERMVSLEMTQATKIAELKAKLRAWEAKTDNFAREAMDNVVDLVRENARLRAMLPSAEVRDGIRKLWNLQSGQPILSRIVVGEWLDSLESEGGE